MELQVHVPVRGRTMLADAGHGRLVVWGREGVFLANGNDIYVGRSLIAYGEYCQGELETLRAYIGSGAHIVEVGANIGAMTVPLARTGGIARVLAIEPQPSLHRALATNCELNNLQNVETMCAAVGAAAGSIVVPVLNYDEPNNFGGLDLDPTRENGHRVPLITLDSLNLEQLDLLKIDVEGMEIDVLRGGAETIKRLGPIISVENDRPEKSEALIAELRGLGYELYWMVHSLYNENNYAGNGVNIFGTAACSNMLCLLPKHGFCDLPIVEGGEHPLADGREETPLR